MNIFQKLILKIDEYFSKNEIELIKQLDKDIADRDDTIKNLGEELVSVKADLNVKDKIVQDYVTKEIELQTSKIQEDFWNSKYPKISVTYSRVEKDGTYYIDPRNYFMLNDKNIPTVSGSNNDEKALNALKHTIGLVKYVSDKTSYGVDEYWAYPYQTLKRGIGDCEDGAILLANIMVKSGIPYWRVRLNAGSVKGGGHAYVTYCRETDNQFVVLDWCYWADTKTPIKDRKLHSEMQNYSDEVQGYGIWFSWNTLYCFGKAQTMAGLPDEFKKVSIGKSKRK